MHCIHIKIKKKKILKQLKNKARAKSVSTKCRQSETNKTVLGKDKGKEKRKSEIIYARKEEIKG